MTTQTNPPHAQSTGATNGGSPDVPANAQQAAGQAQEKLGALAGQLQDRLREQLDQRSSQVAEQINEQASDLRAVGESLREQGKNGPAKAADKLAEYAEKAGGYLSEKDSNGLLDDAETLGRRQPAAVAVGGILLGIAASRFLKASSSRRLSAQSARQFAAAGTGPQSPANDGVRAGRIPVPGTVPPVPDAMPPVHDAVPPAYDAVPPVPSAVPPVNPGIQR